MNTKTPSELKTTPFTDKNNRCDNPAIYGDDAVAATDDAFYECPYEHANPNGLYRIA